MALWAAGWSFLLLALFYALIDVAGYRRWSFPFVVIGANAITAYVGVHFIPFRTIAENLVGGLAGLIGEPWGTVLVTFSAVLILWLVLYHMYRRKIFLRI